MVFAVSIDAVDRSVDERVLLTGLDVGLLLLLLLREAPLELLLSPLREAPLELLAPSAAPTNTSHSATAAALKRMWRGGKQPRTPHRSPNRSLSQQTT